MSVTAKTPGVAIGAAEGLEARLVATIPPLMRHLLAHARRRATWAEMTYQQYNVLRIIDTDGPTVQGEIARRLAVSAPVLTRVAAALVEAGYVERIIDPDDRRSVRLSPTAAGRRQVRAMRRDLLTAAGEVLEPLSAAGRVTVAAALETLDVLLPTGR